MARPDQGWKAKFFDGVGTHLALVSHWSRFCARNQLKKLYLLGLTSWLSEERFLSPSLNTLSLILMTYSMVERNGWLLKVVFGSLCIPCAHAHK